jgi:phosphatidylglycerol lysyltransferase
VLSIGAARPLLFAIAIGGSLGILFATSLWPERSDPRASRAGWILLVLASAATAWSFAMPHAGRHVTLLLTLVLAAALITGFLALTLLNRNGPLPTRHDASHARSLYQSHASSSMGPFAFMRDKAQFWSSDGNSFIAFGRRAGVALALGPAIGSDESCALLYQEFRDACAASGWKPAYYQVSSQVSGQLGLGARYLIGSEAIVHLSGFGLEGSAMAPLRHKVGRALRSGVRVSIVPEQDLDAPTAFEMSRLASASSSGRHLGPMTFSVGGREDAPRVDATVGLAVTTSGELLGYATWLWLPASRTFVLDEMRRAPHAPAGTMDLLLCSCLMGFKGSASCASLGLAPIANPTQARWLAKLEAQVRAGLADNGSGLYEFKAKFRPDWQPRYVVAGRAFDWPAVALAALLLHFPALDQRSRLARRRRIGTASGSLRLTEVRGTSAT